MTLNILRNPSQLRVREAAARFDAAFPLSVKLLVPILALGIFGATFVGVLMYRTEAERIRSDFQRHALFGIEAMRNDLSQHELGLTEAELSAEVQAHVDALASADESVLRVRVYGSSEGQPVLVASADQGDYGADEDLVEIIQDLQALSGETPVVQEEQLADHSALEIIAPLDVPGADGLVVSVYFSTEERASALAALLRTFVLSAGLVLLILPLLLFVVLRVLVFRRLRPIIAATSRMTDGDYTARVEGLLPETARDEFVQLSLRFNAMGEAINDLHMRTQVLATTDELTGLPNRRSMLEALARDIERARRQAEPLAAIMLDVDGLKLLNDRHGHATGDAALRLVATTIQEAIRSGDVPGRLGGDEFGVVLPDCSPHALREVLERIQGRMRERGALQLNVGAALHVGVSGGGAVLRDDETPDSLLYRADQALIEAKQAGGRQIRLAA